VIVRGRTGLRSLSTTGGRGYKVDSKVPSRILRGEREEKVEDSMKKVSYSLTLALSQGDGRVRNRSLAILISYEKKTLVRCSIGTKPRTAGI